jgi:hypothetical protein
VDHLLRLAQLRRKLHVDVVGYGPQDVPGELPANVRCTAFCAGEALLQVLAQRMRPAARGAVPQNMEEASPLKGAKPWGTAFRWCWV